MIDDEKNPGSQPVNEDKMTVHQQRFADAFLEILADPDIKSPKRAAALRAGYSESCASAAAYKCLANPNVQAYIGRHLSVTRARVGIDRSYVLFKAVVAVEMAEANGDHGGMLKALDLVGRHTDVGAFANVKGPADGAGDGGAFGRALETANASDLRTLADLLARLGFGNAASERAGNGEGPPSIN